MAHPVHNAVRCDQPFLFAKKHGPMGLVKFYPVKPDDATKPANTSPKKATSPKPIADPNGEDEKTIEHTIEAPEDGNMWVMKLPGSVARILLATPDHEQQAFILPWGRASLRKGTDVCIVEQGRNGHVLGFARLEQVLRIKAYADLKDYPCFQMYDATQKKAFRDHLQSKKSLFVWIMKEAKVAGASLLLPKMKGPGQFCKRTALQEASDAIVPDMRLASTAEYCEENERARSRSFGGPYEAARWRHNQDWKHVLGHGHLHARHEANIQKAFCNVWCERAGRAHLLRGVCGHQALLHCRSPS